MNRFNLFGVIGLLLAGCSAPKHTLTGTIVTDRWIGRASAGEECEVSINGQYKDLTSNSPVTVFNNKNEIIALGRIEKGVKQSLDGEIYCVVGFAVSSIPDTAISRIGLGNQGRPDMSFSKEELAQKNWQLELNDH